VRLKGDVRFVTCDEPKARSVWDGEIIKQITGSKVTARGSGERTEMTYKPRFKLHASATSSRGRRATTRASAGASSSTSGACRSADTPQGEMPIDDRAGAPRGREEAGILNWLIAGALEWLTTRKIPQPQAMAEVLSDFWADSSPLLEWMGEWCDTSDPNAKTPAKELWDISSNGARTAGSSIR
jgi:putative DNA primase/helicase